ncbi:MAG: BACON domain-containing protein [Bacteroidaceae bacterium]|nr:BACON domain-containing protein [Bacteroidaceae bacterium]
MKRTICTLTVLLLAVYIFGQGCYEENFERGKTLYEQQQYDMAMKSFMAAKSCPDKPSYESLDSWIKKCKDNKAFFVVPNSVTVPASGGTQTFVVSSEKNWSISINVYSWSKLQRDGNRLILTVKPNTSSDARTDYFKLKSGSLEVRVNIKQEGAVSTSSTAGTSSSATSSSGGSRSRTTSTATLNVTPSELSFPGSGGSKTVTVSGPSEWEINIGTRSWGHLTTSGNQITVDIDANDTGSERTDWFSIKSGDVTKRVNITQDAASSASSFAMSGTSRSYTDNAKALKYINDQIKEKQQCRLGALTETGSGIFVYKNNGASWTSIGTNFSNKIKELDNGEKIKSVTMTNSGYYCIVWDYNGWYGNVPTAMSDKLHEFHNNNEEFFSVSICENGSFVIVTNKHFFASNNTDHENMLKAHEKYGQIKQASITNLGLCCVCESGIFYSNIPTNLENKLKSISYKPAFITFTDSGTYIICNEDGTLYNTWL